MPDGTPDTALHQKLIGAVIALGMLLIIKAKREEVREEYGK